MSAEKANPYEHLSDGQLHKLTAEASLLQLRIANTDPRLVLEEMVKCGCPRKDAAGMLADKQLRLGAFRFYFDRMDALLGDREARERCEHVTDAWAAMRRQRSVAEIEADESTVRVG